MVFAKTAASADVEPESELVAVILSKSDATNVPVLLAKIVPIAVDIDVVAATELVRVESDVEADMAVVIVLLGMKTVESLLESEIVAEPERARSLLRLVKEERDIGSDNMGVVNITAGVEFVDNKIKTRRVVSISEAEVVVELANTELKIDDSPVKVILELRYNMPDVSADVAIPTLKELVDATFPDAPSDCRVSIEEDTSVRLITAVYGVAFRLIDIVCKSSEIDAALIDTVVGELIFDVSGRL